MGYEELLEKYNEFKSDKELLYRINEQSKKTIEELDKKLPELVSKLSSNLNTKIFGDTKVSDLIKNIYSEKAKLEESIKQNNEKLEEKEKLLEKVAQICEENIEELNDKKSSAAAIVHQKEEYNIETKLDLEIKEKEKAKLEIELAQIDYFINNGLNSKKDLDRKKELENKIKRLEKLITDAKRLIGESPKKKEIVEIDNLIEKYNELKNKCRAKNISDNIEETVETVIDETQDVNENNNKQEEQYDIIQNILNKDIDSYESSIPESESNGIESNENKANQDVKPLDEPLYVHKDDDKKEDNFDDILNIFNQPINEENNDSIDIKNASIFDNSNESKKEEDRLLNKAAEIVITTGAASRIDLQNRLNIGFTIAEYLLNELEKKGIVGPSNGQRDRKVLMSLDEFMSKNNNKKGNMENIDIELNKEDKLPEIEPLYVQKDNDLEEKLQNLGYKEQVPESAKKTSLDELFEPFVEQIEKEQTEQQKPYDYSDLFKKQPSETEEYTEETLKKMTKEELIELITKKGNKVPESEYEKYNLKNTGLGEFTVVNGKVYFLTNNSEKYELKDLLKREVSYLVIEDTLIKVKNFVEKHLKKTQKAMQEIEENVANSEKQEIARKVKKNVSKEDSENTIKKGLKFLHDFFIEETKNDANVIPENTIMCPNPDCGCMNPSSEKYCRNCGKSLVINFEDENTHGRKM